MKTCTGPCKRTLPEEMFYLRAEGCRRGLCLDCHSAYMKRYHQNQAPLDRQQRRARQRDNWYRTAYGISAADYDRMVADRRGLCDSCGNPPTGKRGAAVLHVDHDHATNVIRGLLCGPCNQALGLLKDDPNAIYQLLLYARKHERPRLALVA